MIKLIGMICIVLASSGAGAYMGDQLTRRVRELIELKRAMELVHGEIRYQLTPLPTVLIEISYKIKPPFSSIFSQIGTRLEARGGETFLSIWEDQWEQYKKQLTLNIEDLKLIHTMGTSLGYLDKEMQLNAIDFFINQLDIQIEEARDLVHKKKRLYQMLGIMGGFLLVIILI